MGFVIVVAGGDPPTGSSLDGLPEPDLVVAADSGLEHAFALGRRVDVLVGDLDSVSPGALARAERDGIVIERHPTGKDATDLELALETARRTGAERIAVIGGAGGRVDHFLANALALASPTLASVRVEARIGAANVHVVRDCVQLTGLPGDLCTLLAVGGPAQGVTTEGLRYPLGREDLLPGSTRGVSNEFAEPTVRVTVTDGVLLAVLPSARRNP